jgi:hypothetical protein
LSSIAAAARVDIGAGGIGRAGLYRRSRTAPSPTPGRTRRPADPGCHAGSGRSQPPAPRQRPVREGRIGRGLDLEHGERQRLVGEVDLDSSRPGTGRRRVSYDEGAARGRHQRTPSYGRGVPRGSGRARPRQRSTAKASRRAVTELDARPVVDQVEDDPVGRHVVVTAGADAVELLGRHRAARRAPSSAFAQGDRGAAPSSRRARG